MGEGACVHECVHMQLCGYILVKPERKERDALKGLFARRVGIQGWLLNKITVRIRM